MTDLTEGALAGQLRLPFPDTIKGFDDLAITDANRAALDMARRWQDWQSSALCLIGPVQSGLGVAAQLWARETGGRLFRAADFDALDIGGVEAAAAQNCVIDLADQVTNEANLLAMLNLCHDRQTRLLLTARSAGIHWPCQSADLKSRLDTIPVAEIYPPDETMVAARLQASCKRRFIKLNKATVDFLVIRLPRSYAAIEDYVVRLDAAVNETGKAPGIYLAKAVLEEGATTRNLFDGAG